MLPITFLTLLAAAASYTDLSIVLAIKTFGISLIVNYVSFAPNEYFDYSIDRKSKRKEIMGTFISDKKLAKFSIFVVFLFTVSFSFILPDTAQIAILFITVTSALYSIPPFRFKGRAPLDSIFNIIGVYFIFAAGVGIAGGGFNDVIPGAYWFSAFIGFGAHALLAIPDMDADREENLRTMPMMIGQRGVALITQILIISATLLENFSRLTTTLLFASVLALTYLWKERSAKELTNFAILGVIVIMLYLTAYVLTRGVI